jgi:hypothetical protein
MPDVDNLLTCFAEGVSSGATDEWLTVLPLARFLLLIVTLEGMKLWPRAEPLRGDARGGVLIGAGNFDLAD